MRKIAIIGSGLAGLVCAHGLRRAGHSVTLYSDRTPEAWLSSQPTGVAARFWQAIGHERELGLNHWEEAAPRYMGVQLTLCLALRNRLLTSTGRFSKYGQAVDPRLQSHRWMIDLVDRGGKVEIGEVTIARLEEIAREHDLTIVSTGKGGLASLFPRDEPRSVHTKPQRQLMMVFLKGPSIHREGIPFPAVKYKLLATAGEVFCVPFYHKDVGPSWALGVEAKPGRALDRFRNARSAKEVLALAKTMTRELLPWEHDWLKDAEVSDEQGWLVGAVTPAVRHPVGRLPSGQIVTALGDTATAYDPIAAQGANSGNRMARHLVDSIAARGDRPFDEAWMTATFERFWDEHGRYAVDVSNLLLEPPSPMAVAYLVAQYGSDGRAGRDDGAQALADAFVENLARPSTLTPILLDQVKIRSFIREKMGGLVGSVAKSVPRILRAQVRQVLGQDPGHPIVAHAAAT